MQKNLHRSKIRKTYWSKVSILFVITLILILLFTLKIDLFNHQQLSIEAQLPSSTNSPMDSMVRQGLDSINYWGWNPSVKGMWINWYMDNPTSHQNSGYDSQNDFNMYANMVWYQYRHPGDISQQAAISRILPTIQSTWANTQLSKGWVYFELQRIRQFTEDSSWDTTASSWAAHTYGQIDPNVGVSHGPVVDSTGAGSATFPDAYRVDQNVENGLALIDAGNRFNKPEWIQAGQREVNVITQQGFVTKYHLYTRVVCNNSGTWSPCNWEAKGGEFGQETDSFFRVGQYLNSIGQNGQPYIAKAQEMLNAVSDPATGLRDTQNPGFFYKMDLNTGVVSNSKKEIRQFHALVSLHELNVAGLGNANTISMESDLVKAVQLAFKQSTSHTPVVAGWMYEENPDWSIYKGTETWISTEASVIAMFGMQEVLMDNSSPSTTLMPSSGTPLPTNPQGALISVTVCPHGIANCGDNANANSIGNSSPQHLTRTVTVNFLNGTNQQIAALQGTVVYNTSSGTFDGAVPVGNIPKGSYIIIVKMPGFLPKQLPGIISITQGQNVNLPAAAVITGDINNDNQLDISDYNLLVACFGSKPCANKTASDINDDGSVSGVDYNLFLRELSVQK